MNHNKVIFLGESGVGKTSIIMRRRNHAFSYDMAPTIGVGYECIDEKYDEKNVQLYLWDTAGQEQFNSVVPIYCREAKVAVIVASLTDASSVKEIDKWNRFCEESEYHPFVIVVINKIDITPDDTLSSAKKELIAKFDTIFFVSAKSGSGIDELFSFIAQTIYETSIKEHPEVSRTIELEEPESKRKKKDCC